MEENVTCNELKLQLIKGILEMDCSEFMQFIDEFSHLNLMMNSPIILAEFKPLRDNYKNSFKSFPAVIEVEKTELEKLNSNFNNVFFHLLKFKNNSMKMMVILTDKDKVMDIDFDKTSEYKSYEVSGKKLKYLDLEKGKFKALQNEYHNFFKKVIEPQKAGIKLVDYLYYPISNVAKFLSKSNGHHIVYLYPIFIDSNCTSVNPDRDKFYKNNQLKMTILFSYYSDLDAKILNPINVTEEIGYDIAQTYP